MSDLPDHFEPYTDTYFLRSQEILKAENLNPFVRAQIHLKKGPGNIFGITEAVQIIKKFSELRKNSGRIFALSESDEYSPFETVMIIEGRAQDIIPFETMILGVISSETTVNNDKHDVDLTQVTERTRQIVNLVGKRPVVYFGARHWRFDKDKEISKAAFDGGASDASTDVGASVVGKTGVGTIPHSLECMYAWKYGMDRAVVETVKAFDRVIDPSVPRIALIDFNNREIDDSLSSTQALGKTLFAVRVDTCWENTMQGASQMKSHENDAFWYGGGVTISGVYALRKALDEHGFEYVKIFLTSGFGNPEKVSEFVSAENELGIRLFDGLGVGELFPSRTATMDVVGVGDSLESLRLLSKVGRVYKPNAQLQQVL